MTDLEITKLCAQAMGLDDWLPAVVLGVEKLALPDGTYYDPLHHDAQAMALVKNFGLHIDGPSLWAGKWFAFAPNDVTASTTGSHNKDLNRAICETVAKMQKAKP